MHIYVSNLSTDMTDDSLKALFARFGNVGSARIVMDVFNGQSRGFAFVEMTDDAEGAKAISELNNSSLEDRTITVREADLREVEPLRGSYPVRPRGKAY